MNGLDANRIFLGPSLSHWLGTDSLGRDFLMRVLRGSGISLLIAIQSIGVILILALLYGGVSGWVGRRLDRLMMILLDIWMSLPSSALAAVVALIFSHRTGSAWMVSLVIGATHWGRLARLIRGEVLSVKEKNYIKASESMGASGLEVLRTHILPHLTSVLIVYVLYQIPNLIITESFLSFIGLGVQAPETSWGLLLQDGWRSLQVYPHVVFFPAIFMFLTVLSLNSLIIPGKEHRSLEG
jgi:oligopeptide transport system permease protein